VTRKKIALSPITSPRQRATGNAGDDNSGMAGDWNEKLARANEGAKHSR